MRVRGAEGGRWRAAWLAVFLAGWVNIRGCSCSIGYRVVAVCPPTLATTERRPQPPADSSAVSPESNHTHCIPRHRASRRRKRRRRATKKEKEKLFFTNCFYHFVCFLFSPDIVDDLQVHCQPFSPTNATCQFIRSLSRSPPGFQQPIQARYHSPIISYPTSPCISCVHCSRPNPGVQ